jgi:hypothetical protein
MFAQAKSELPLISHQLAEDISDELQPDMTMKFEIGDFKLNRN